MTRHFLTSLALCLGASLLASCSLFQATPDKEPEAKKEKKPSTPVITEVSPLPGGDPIMPVSTSVDPMLPMTRPFIREPDVTTSLPLNLDGTTVKAAGELEAIPDPQPELPAVAPVPPPATATSPLAPATATEKTTTSPTE